ncbi:MAG TPA: RNA polymerase sigma-70 factor [Chryseosolibacter sp.]
MRSECQYTEQQLVERLVEGDRHAFEVIYKTYAPCLISYSRRSIPVKEDCEGIVQEIFEWLWAKRDTLHRLNSLRAYLFKMARYKVIDHIRRCRVKKRYEEHYLSFVGQYSTILDPSQDLSEIYLLIEKSVSALPERCQKAFRLRFDDELPYKDIALHMKISTKTVEKHISAALQHLRSVYQNDYNRFNAG